MNRNLERSVRWLFPVAIITMLLLTIRSSYGQSAGERLIATGTRSDAFAPESPEFHKAAPGIWAVRYRRGAGTSLLETAGAAPLESGLEKLGHGSFPLPEGAVTAWPVGDGCCLRVRLTPEEQLYGWGLHFKSVGRRGRILRLHVDHYGGRDDGRTHGPVPFVVSSRGWGLFVDSARYLDVYNGTSVFRDSPDHPPARDRNRDRDWSARPASDGLEILVPTPGLRAYLFAGPTPLDAVKRYNLFCGGGCLPPLWGLGFWHRVPTLFTDRDVRAEVAAFRDREFPLSVLGLEPGWMSRSYPCTYMWDEERFPDPEGLVSDLKRDGIRVNCWMNPYVAPGIELERNLRPLSGTHTVWCGIAPDYTLPEARAFAMDHFERHAVGRGISGFKIDECDGYDVWLWPDTARFPSGRSGEVMRQVYGSALQKMFQDVYRARNQRTYGLARAVNGGACALPFVLYNDYYSHPDFITALVNASFCGLLWTPEARSSKSGEEWLRRMQSVCFSPLAMLNAWASGTKPWSFPEVEDAVRDVARLRMRFLPYLYTAFARYRHEGLPPFRAMALCEGVDPQAAGGIKDQYMMGDALLVAPLFAGRESRKVILPEGEWFDFYTGKSVGKGGTITVTPGLTRIPLFVRDGGIIPLMPALLRTPGPGRVAPLEIRYYGHVPGKALLYEDDGVTFDHERGAFQWRRLEVARDPEGRMTGTMSEPAPGKPRLWGGALWRFMTPPSEGAAKAR